MLYDIANNQITGSFFSRQEVFGCIDRSAVRVEHVTVNGGGYRSDVMHELSLRIGRAVQTHFQNFLCEERCDSFADSRSYCRWRSALIVKVMQLN